MRIDKGLIDKLFDRSRGDYLNERDEAKVRHFEQRPDFSNALVAFPVGADSDDYEVPERKEFKPRDNLGQ